MVMNQLKSPQTYIMSKHWTKEEILRKDPYLNQLVLERQSKKGGVFFQGRTQRVITFTGEYDFNRGPLFLVNQVIVGYSGVVQLVSVSPSESSNFEFSGFHEPKNSANHLLWNKAKLSQEHPNLYWDVLEQSYKQNKALFYPPTEHLIAFAGFDFQHGTLFRVYKIVVGTGGIPKLVALEPPKVS